MRHSTAVIANESVVLLHGEEKIEHYMKKPARCLQAQGEHAGYSPVYDEKQSGAMLFS